MKAIQRITLKEYDLTVDARLAGRTLYTVCTLEGLVGKDLGLQKEALEKLEGAMLSSTRVALSSDADIRFMVLTARDSRLGTSITLVRYFPDIKGIIYYRLSRSDFEDRLVLETENVADPGAPDDWHEVTMPEFMARLSASRLQRQFTANPLVSVFLQVRQVKGRVSEGVLRLTLDKFTTASDPAFLVEEVLRSAVEETVADVVKKYDRAKYIRRVVVSDNNGRALMEMNISDLLKKKKSGKARGKPA